MNTYLPRNKGRTRTFGGCLSGLLLAAAVIACFFFGSGWGREFLQSLFPGVNSGFLRILTTAGFIGLTILIIVGGIGWGLIKNARRREERKSGMQTAARLMGWHYSPAPPAKLLPYLDGIKLSRGDSRFAAANVSDVLSGQLNSAMVAVFDHTFQEKSGSSSTTYWETVFMVSSNKLALPNFHTQQEGFLDSFFNDIRNRPDINFPHRPKFSKQYLLRGAEVERIRGVFTDPVLQFYEDQFPLETVGGGNSLCIFQPRENNAPVTDNEIQLWIKGLMQLHDLLATDKRFSQTR